MHCIHADAVHRCFFTIIVPDAMQGHSAYSAVADFGEISIVTATDMI